METTGFVTQCETESQTISVLTNQGSLLKSFVVDPFDDTPESVISRLLDIADKAKSKWTAWDGDVEETGQQER